MSARASTEEKVREKAEIVDAEGLRRAITRIAHEIVEKNGGARDIVLVGIQRRGVPLAKRIAEKVREFLATSDVVLGPAEDGGYYAIGLREAHDVFRGVAWSSATVLDETLRRAQDLGLSVGFLEPGFDVDEPEDLERLRQLLASGTSEDCPETRSVLERVLAPSA